MQNFAYGQCYSNVDERKVGGTSLNVEREILFRGLVWYTRALTQTSDNDVYINTIAKNYIHI